ncbi:MAG: hypothetical protein EOP10_31795 [Proteobacteria bacterium]|nr:MAG: hypothetical protein EOP10_31795 [Pseudomonadota bacterium]
MAGIFETATKEAIREILLSAMHESRFGYVLSPDNLETLNNQIFDLFLTSRNLKAAGDKFLGIGAPPLPKGSGFTPTLKR